MTVEVMREDEVLMKYLLPWSTRVQSKYLSVPGDGGSDPRDPTPGPKGSSMNPLATKLDPWRGFNRSTVGEWKTDKMYLCVPGVDSTPNRKVRHLASPDVFYCSRYLIKSADDSLIILSLTCSTSPRYWSLFSTI